MMRRRVAITGMGVVSPLGNDLEAMWIRALSGESAIAAHDYINAATGHTLTIPSAAVPPESVRVLEKTRELMLDKFGRFALIAGADAISAASIDLAAEDSTRCGTSTGTCMSGITETEAGFNAIYVNRRARVHPFTVIRTMANSPCAWLSIDHHLTGPSLSFANTCASSSVAIGEAAMKIRYGAADVMIAGGTETLLTYSAVNCWESAKLLAPVHDDPKRSCRPFDMTRNGTALGEGAAYLVLEE
jgi:3-oxoacyl-(acyl-carrier-protein) synthase